ncbi:hypothetical protein DFR74_10418 [Nocardia puris]|uniref:Uncharacterized protein n=2 Tax=Nocardia puris TaxID=208602 RepID=A0A366DMP4_9NOCA|nr:hypothetical protein DFR74_10418 [Nocardia puris]
MRTAADRALVALTAWAGTHGPDCTVAQITDRDQLEMLGDFVADVLHLVDRQAVDVGEVLDMALLHYGDEIRDAANEAFTVDSLTEESELSERLNSLLDRAAEPDAPG